MDITSLALALYLTSQGLIAALVVWVWVANDG